MKLVYRTIQADPTSVKAEELIKDLLDKIDNGWVILSAVGVAGGVHYILKKKNQ